METQATKRPFAMSMPSPDRYTLRERLHGMDVGETLFVPGEGILQAVTQIAAGRKARGETYSVKRTSQGGLLGVTIKRKR